MDSRFVLGLCLSCCILAAGCDEDATTEAPVAPGPEEDRVGLPANYETTFKQYYVFDRPDNRQVRRILANDIAASGPPFKEGSILVMETYSTIQSAGTPVLGPDGRFQKNALAGIFVMKKERGFGPRYGEHQTGDWEYASFTAAKAPNVVGDAAAAGCAVCHLDAGPQRDWVYRANLAKPGASGAVPTVPAGQAADAPTMNSYMFLPATTTVKVGTRVTWRNNDQVKHTVTARDGSFSALVSQGASFGRVFNTVGTHEILCAIHPSMRATVVVTP